MRGRCVVADKSSGSAVRSRCALLFKPSGSLWPCEAVVPGRRCQVPAVTVRGGCVFMNSPPAEAGRWARQLYHRCEEVLRQWPFEASSRTVGVLLCERHASNPPASGRV
eukprot:scaffold63871_cov36-Phaeocystis_antarctica.AAC.1